MPAAEVGKNRIRIHAMRPEKTWVRALAAEVEAWMQTRTPPSRRPVKE
jgi:hypothetical protein